MHGCWFKQFLIQLLAILTFEVIPNGKSNLTHTLYALCTLYAFYMHYSWTSLSALSLGKAEICSVSHCSPRRLGICSALMRL